MNSEIVKVLKEVSSNPELLEVARLAIEDELIDWRNSRLHEWDRANGFVVREVDGSASSLIRFGPETGVRIGLEAIVKHCQKKLDNDTQSE